MIWVMERQYKQGGRWLPEQMFFTRAKAREVFRRWREIYHGERWRLSKYERE
jgi:hypothetical protein